MPLGDKGNFRSDEWGPWRIAIPERPVKIIEPCSSFLNFAPHLSNRPVLDESVRERFRGNWANLHALTIGAYLVDGPGSKSRALGLLLIEEQKRPSPYHLDVTQQEIAMIFPICKSVGNDLCSNVRKSILKLREHTIRRS